MNILPDLLSYNEEPNISHTLSCLQWAKTIIVLDSNSTDSTQQIALSFPNVIFHTRDFDTHAKQWNYALSLSKTNWVLALDSDYIVTEQLISEISNLDLSSTTYSAFFLDFKYVVFGQCLNSSILPPRPSLFNRLSCSYYDDGHTQALHIDGPSSQLHSPLLHVDRKSLKRWLWAQQNVHISKLIN